MKVKGTIACKESVVMENGEHVGQLAFTKGKEYKISSVNVYDTIITIVAVCDFETPHVLMQARVHSVDTQFLRGHFESCLI